MRTFTVDEIRKTFSGSTDFNEIFDAFQSALAQDLRDVEPYRLLFWNQSLTTDEVRLFGEKLAAQFPELAFDVYLWLAGVFEVTVSAYDNYELALEYYRKAALARPEEADPYLDACECYEPDLNIPPLSSLIEFVARGITRLRDPRPVYRRLARLYEYAGEPGRAEECRRKAEEGDPGGTPPGPVTDA